MRIDFTNILNNFFIVYRFKQHTLIQSNPANSSQLPLSSVSPHSVQA